MSVCFHDVSLCQISLACSSGVLTTGDRQRRDQSCTHTFKTYYDVITRAYIVIRVSFQNFAHSPCCYYCFFFSSQCRHMSFVDFVVLPPGHGRSVTDYWVWDAHEAQLRCPDYYLMQGIKLYTVVMASYGIISAWIFEYTGSFKKIWTI